MSIKWRLFGVRVLERTGMALPAMHELPLAELSSMPVAMLTLKWIQIITDWISTTSHRTEARGADDPLSSSIVLRMDEFTSKDLALRSQIMRTALVHFRVIREDTKEDADITSALSVFSVHSQAGSNMSGPKSKVLTDGDVDVIKRCVVGALAQCADVQDGGANIVLQRSLGVRIKPNV